VSSKHTTISKVTISPLPFWPTLESTGDLLAAMLEQDAMFQKWLGRSGILRALTRSIFMPLYYHMITSGYGAFIGEELAGWLYLRGWRQILYIETLATKPAWRKQGVASALLRFAEEQARELHRQWLGLTVTASNEAAVQLYEKHGYRRAHWRIAQCDGGASLPSGESHEVRLQPIFGPTAWRAHRRFTAIDLAAGEGWVAPASTRLLDFDPHRQLGREWLVNINDERVAYLNRYGSRSGPHMYLACGPDWWADPRMTQAIGAALSIGAPASKGITLRLASSGHHDAALPLLSALGFGSRSASMFKMFNYLGGGQSGVSQSRDGAKL
jgi:GNAT superfamily N-acetyltransferase